MTFLSNVDRSILGVEIGDGFEIRSMDAEQFADRITKLENPRYDILDQRCRPLVA